MAFVKAHGLEMAAGGYVKNMVIETFTTATEPTPTEQGRTWYNSDSDRWIMSVDNGSGSIIKRTFANLEELEAHAALVISTTEGEGANNVGYEGSGVQTNGLFALSAGLLDDVLDTITGNIDAEMKIADDLETNKLSRDGTQAMTANLDMDGNKLVNLASGTDAGDAVTKAQLDAVQSGLDTKESCRAATTTNLSATYDNAAGTLTASANGHLEMDNVRLDVGNRVLVMDQTNGYENGIYDVTVAGSAGAAAEVTDVTMVADTAGDMSGRYFLVNDPTTEYFVWLDTGASTSPDAAGKPLEGLGKTGIQVVITANDDAATIAGLVQVAVNNATDFDASVLSSVVTISNVNDGNVTAAANAENDAYDIGSTINVTTQGDEAAAVFVLTRSADADNLPGAEVTSGMFTFIEEGTSAGDNGFQLVTNEVVTLGVTDLNMVQFTGAGQVIADHGLRKSGNEMDVFIADFIDTAEGLKSDGAGSGFSSKIQWDATTAKWTGQAGTNGEFTIASTNMDNAMDSIVDEIDSYKSEIRSQTAAEGSSNVGYDGQTTTHTLFTLAASQVDAALDSVADGLDAEMKSTDEHIASLVCQTAAEGSSNVGYDGVTTANSLFNLAAAQVDATLDSLATGLDAEMKNQDDYEALLLSQTAAEGSSKVGYDGITTSNSLFNLAAAQVDASLDSLATGLDAEMKATDDYIALLASTTEGEGANNVGFEGYAGTNTEFSVAASSLDSVLDTIIQAIDDDRASEGGTSGAATLGYEGETGANGLYTIAGPTNVGAALDGIVQAVDTDRKVLDDYQADVLSQTAAEGSALVGYDGNTPSNSLFSLAAAQVDATLDSLATGLDAEMKATDDYIALLASQTDGEGAANVGYDGANGANALFSLAAGQVDASLNALVTGLDAEMKNQDDYEALLLSQTAAEGSSKVGYDGAVGTNTQFSLAASQVDAALDSLMQGVDTEMQTRSDADDAIVTNFNALSTVGTSAAAYTHTIAHTYGQDILPQIWVDQSGNWVFDIVAITNNNNSLVVELTEQKQIKYAIFSMGDISKS